MTALFAQVQDGPVCTGTGSVALTCAPTAAETELFAFVFTPDPGPFTPPSAGWRLAKTMAAPGGAGHFEAWYLEGGNQPGGLSSATFAGPAGKACSGFLCEQSLPSGYSIIIDAAGQAAAAAAGTSMAVAAAAGCAADALGFAVFAEFFSTSQSGTWTTPAGWIPAQVRSGSSQAGWAVYRNQDLAAGMPVVTSGFTATANAAGWCAGLVMFRAVRFTPMGVAGGERLEVCAPDPTSQIIIAGGDVEGLWRSADPAGRFGDHWQPVLDGVYGGNWNQVAALAWSVMPGEPAGTVYALTGDQGSGGGFMVSADGGRTWTMRSTGVQAAANAAGSPPRPAGEDAAMDRWVGHLIAQDPVNNYIYACDANTGWVKRSHDLGATWTAIPFAGAGTFYCRGVICNPGDGKEIWACNWSTTTGNGGVWHCPDATVATPAWTRLTGYTGTCADLLIIGNWLYVAANTGGVYRAPLSGSALTSLNGGVTGGVLASPTSTALVGATTTAGGGYGSGNKLTAAGVFDSRLDPAGKGDATKYPLAKTAQKYYFTSGAMSGAATTWPTAKTAFDNAEGSYGDLAGAGVVFLLSLKPSRAAVVAGGATLTAEKAAFKTFLTNLKTWYPGSISACTPWQECNQPAQNWFTDTGGAAGTVPSYQAYWNAFGPQVQAAGIPLAYDPMIADVNASLNTAISMFPNANANCLPDVVYVDWYGAAWKSGIGANDPATWAGGNNPDTKNSTGQSLLSLTRALPGTVPFGIGEWGDSATGNTIDAAPVYGNPASYKYWSGYVKYLIGLMSGLVSSNYPIANIMWYSGDSITGANTVAAPDANGNPDYKVALIDKVYDTFSSTTTTGAGGGGLVVNGTVKYNSIDGYGDGTGNHTIIAGVGDGTKPSGTGAHYTSVMQLGIPSGWPASGSISYTDLTNQAGGTINVTTLPPDGRPWWKAGGGFANWLGGGAFKDPHVVVDQNDTQRIYVAGTGGFWRTADGGKTWETAVNGMVMIQTVLLAADPVTPGHIITGGDDYSTFDLPDIPAVSAGVTPLGLPGTNIQAHAVCFGPDGTVYAGGNLKYGQNAGGGVWSHPPGKLVWSAELGFAAKSGGSACTGVYAGTDASGTTFLLAVAQAHGTYRATLGAGGTWTWSASTVGPMGSKVTGQVTPFASRGGAVIYCFDRPAGIYRSNDYGVTWTLIWNGATGGGNQDTGWLALNPNVNGELWISSANSPHGLYKMTGAAGSSVGMPGGPTVAAVTAGPPDPGGLAFYNGVLYVVQLNSAATPSAQLWSFDGTTWRSDIAPEIGSYLSDPRQMLATADGHLLIESGYNGYVWAALAPVTLPALAVDSSGALAGGVVGQAYPAGTGLAAHGGTGLGYTWARASGALPGGLTLNADGSITGTPSTATGSPFSFTATVTDSGSHTATSGTLTIAVTAAAPLIITTTSVPPGVLGSAYGPGVAIAAAGGTAPITFAVTAGALPAGLSLNSSTGAITGTPSAAGSFGFDITATDSASPTPATTTQSYTIVIPAAGLTITTTAVPPKQAGSAVSVSLFAGGGAPGVLTWQVIDTPTTGALPAGLTLTSNPSSPYNGVISGTAPATPGAVTVEIQVTDNAGSIASEPLTITITPLPPPPGAAALFMISEGQWVQPSPSSLSSDGTAWQPDTEWTISGGVWGGAGTGAAAGTYPGTYGPVY